MKEDLKKLLCDYYHIESDHFNFDTNLFNGYIDSLGFIEYGELVIRYASSKKIDATIEDFLTEGCLSIDQIEKYLMKKMN